MIWYVVEFAFLAVADNFFLTDPQFKGLVDANMMGRKSGKGMFVYAEGSKDRPVNQDALNIIKKFSLEAPAATGGDEDITLRLICR